MTNIELQELLKQYPDNAEIYLNLYNGLHDYETKKIDINYYSGDTPEIIFSEIED